jgi:polyribonucleotide nucleotidyltransferase
VAAVKVGLVDGQLLLNPGRAQQAASLLDLTYAGTADRATMIECSAKQVGWQADRLAGWQAGRLAGWQAAAQRTALGCDPTSSARCGLPTPAAPARALPPPQVPEETFVKALELAQAAVARLVAPQLQLAQRRGASPAQLHIAAVPGPLRAALEALARPLADEVLAARLAAKADRGGALAAGRARLARLAEERGLAAQHELEVGG